MRTRTGIGSVAVALTAGIYIGIFVKGDTDASVARSDPQAPIAAYVGGDRGEPTATARAEPRGQQAANQAKKKRDKPRATLGEIGREIQRLRNGGGAARDFINRVTDLGRLAQTDDKAFDLLLTLLGDTEFEFHHKATIFAGALEPFSDDRIGEIAIRLLEYKIDQGLASSIHHTDGYLRMLALSGGQVGVERMELFVEELLDKTKPNRDLADEAMRCMGSMRERVSAATIDRLVDAMAQKQVEFRHSHSVASGVFRHARPAQKRKLLEIAKNPRTFEPLRTELYRGYGRSLSMDDLPELVRQYAAGDEEDRKMRLYAVGAALTNRDLEPQDRLRFLEPLLLGVIRDENTYQVAKVLDWIRGVPLFRTDAIMAALKARRDDLRPERQYDLDQLLLRLAHAEE